MTDYIKKLKQKIENDNIKIEYFASLPSTNAFLKKQALTLTEGHIVIAHRQTAGRGRFDRKFHSPEDTGIYMSILLKPRFSGFNTTLITTAAAVAVAKACDCLNGKKSQIKWVNDVLIDGKKVCGILTEGSINPKTAMPEYIVLGIGINAFAPENGFEEDIKDIAGSVFTDYNTDLNADLTALVINNFFQIYNNIADKAFINEYKERSAVLGKEITVIKGEKKYTALATHIDDECRLRVEYPDKTTEFLSSGEISIKI